MPQICAYSPVPNANVAAAEMPPAAKEPATIQEAIDRLRCSVTAWSSKPFRHFNIEGAEAGANATLNIEPVLQALNRLEATTPKRLILSSNRSKAVEILNRICQSVDRITAALEKSGHEEHAAEASKILAEVFADQQKLLDEINDEIPNESAMLHIRTAVQCALLVIGIGAIVALNVLTAGLPMVVIVGISLLSIVANFIWNRYYDVRMTPCLVWNPIRDVIGKIRLSVENANMFAMTVINRLEPRLERLEPRLERLEPRIEKTENQVDKLETKVTEIKEEVASEISHLKNRVQILLDGNEKLAKDNQKMMSLLFQLVNQQAAGTTRQANTSNAAANDDMPPIGVVHFG